jgi:hypothetical protein
MTSSSYSKRCVVTRRTGAKRQQPASPKTVRNAQVMLRRALGQAELRGHVRRNVAKLVPSMPARDQARPQQGSDSPTAREGVIFVALRVIEGCTRSRAGSAALNPDRHRHRSDPPSGQIDRWVLSDSPGRRLRYPPAALMLKLDELGVV